METVPVNLFGMHESKIEIHLCGRDMESATQSIYACEEKRKDKQNYMCSTAEVLIPCLTNNDVYLFFSRFSGERCRNYV